MKTEASNIKSDKINDGYKFKFSVVMAVYGVEEYLAEAMDSLVCQSVGFENIQVILVDDGSPDSSGRLCDEYAEKYPENVVVIHKENGGVSSARNAGLERVEGRFVNCMDPDDMLTPNTMELVWDFFTKNENHTDVVGIPIEMFGDINGPHYLNDKFNRGTRVINLRKEIHFLQLSCSTAFIRHEVAKSLRFDTTLAVAEDAKEMLRILIDKPALGVVADCAYLYRKHTGSALSVGLRACWYNDYIYSFVLHTIDYAKSVYGYLPRFVQYALMSNMQWRLTERDIPTAISTEELERYREGLAKAIAEIDNDIILKQKNCSADVRVKLISDKYPREEYITKAPGDVIFGFDSDVNGRASTSTLTLDFIEFTKDEVKLHIRQTYLTVGGDMTSPRLLLGDREIEPEKSYAYTHNQFLGDAMSKNLVSQFVIRREWLGDENTVGFTHEIDGTRIVNENLKPGPHFPIEAKYAEAYCYAGGLILRLADNRLIIKKATEREAKAQEKKFRRELWHSNGLGERKAVIARILARIYKFFHRKPIWIISDRLNKSGDNGEAFFRYLKSIKYKKASYFYAICKCPSYYKMKKLGDVVNYDSLYYKVLHLAADTIISAQADLPVATPFPHYSQPYKDILARQRFIFLQHGIIESDLSGWLNRFNKNLRGFTTTVRPEFESILNGNYHYTERELWLVGMARFDRLYHDEKKQITIMPTWRKYLMSHMDTQTGIWQEKSGFTDSAYFKFYNSLINDERLLAAAKKHGYTVAFMPHPNIITKIDKFGHSEGVRFYTVDDEYRCVYAESNLVLTDYSSAAFDFAYLRKPILYAQFDKADFYGGDHVGATGYFDFERDGFGEVAYDYERTVDLLIEYMENGCQLKDKYRERVDAFFPFGDKDNCKRVLEKIEGIKEI